MQLNLHHLRIFYFVVLYGNTYKAAQKLHISQPAVSTQISRFEKDLGFPLFERKNSQLMITNNGKKVYGYASQIFSIESELIHQIQDIQNKSVIRISCHQLAYDKFIQPILSNINAKISVEIKSTGDIINLLEEKATDIAIVGVRNTKILDDISTNYSSVSLMHDRICFVTRNSNKQEQLNLADFKNNVFIGRPPESYSQRVLEDFFEFYNLGSPCLNIYFDGHDAALEYALNNDVVFVSSYTLVEDLISLGQLSEVEVYNPSSFNFDHSIYLLFNHHMSPNLKEIIRLIQNH